MRGSMAAITLATVLALFMSSARAHDESKYPDWAGQWRRPPGIANQFDTSKPPREGQKPPLTPEYQAIWEANLKDQAAGGNVHVEIAGQNYFLSADGFLMPARKDQPPPSLKYFEQPRK